MSIQFLDASLAPLPPGIDVVITQGGTTIGSGTTDGTGSISVSVTQGESYTATFSGSEAPPDPVDFVGGSNQYLLNTDGGDNVTTDTPDYILMTTGTTTTVEIPGYVSDPVDVTQVASEPLVVGDGSARGTSVVSEALATSDGNLRDTSVSTEILAVGEGSVHVTQDATETLLVGTSSVYDTQFALEVLVPYTPINVIVTQTVLKALVRDSDANVRVTQAVLKALVTATTSQYTVGDFVTRVINLLPKPWWSRAALQPGGYMYVLIYAVAYALSGHKILQLDFVKNQSRILTASGQNLDNIALDFLGTTILRLPGETDAAFRLRIIQAIIGPKVTLAAMIAGVDEYFASEFETDYSARPTAYIFDRQSDPTNADLYDINPPEFVIQVNYPLPAGIGWALGRTKGLGITTPQYATVLESIPGYVEYSGGVFDPGLKAVVDSIRAEGTKPVYLGTRTY